MSKVVTAYFAAASALDAKGMAACFAPEGVLVDPAAPGPVKGRAALEGFYGAIVGAFSKLDIREEGLVVSGRFAAARFVGEGTTAAGKPIRFEGLDVFELNAEGKITALHGFWDPSALAGG